ncbi:hypothetical protein [Actinomadura sp. CNU-125]|uniref:hypothetical protein n=1 Tax=Actinomadura sp. CNU-125 TaxID=1904961 RepID=UPI0021CC5903|nr:hypothetical protein [Actinomadura sp. CNU-125]
MTDRRRIPLAVKRWRGLADQDDRWLLTRCHGVASTEVVYEFDQVKWHVVVT